MYPILLSTKPKKAYCNLFAEDFLYLILKKHSTNNQHYKLKKKKVTAAHSLGTPEAYPIVERLLF